MDYWDNKEANSLNGTDGTYFPPYPSPEKNIYIFIPDVCRLNISNA